MPKSHSTLTLADDNSLLKAISLGLRVASGKGFSSHGLRGYALSLPNMVQFDYVQFELHGR